MESGECRFLRDAVQHEHNLLVDKMHLLGNFKDAQVSDRAVLFVYSSCTDSLIELCSLFTRCKTHRWYRYSVKAKEQAELSG
jgi:hypothetical protein